MANLETLHQRANDALINEQTERAIEIYNQILAELPSDEIALSQLMDLYYSTNRELYYLTRANLNISHQKYEHAINDCKKAIGTEPNSLPANIKLARLYKVTKKNLRAIDIFSHILEIDPENFESYKELTDLYLLENSPQSAVGILQKGIEHSKNKEKEFFQNLLAKIYFDLGDYENATAVALDETLKIKILLQKGDSIEAKKMLDKCNLEKMTKEQKASHASLLAQYYYNENEFEKALDAVNNYVELNLPDAISFQMKALIFEQMDKPFESAYSWGFCNKVQGKFEEAIVEFLHAFQIDSKNKNNLIELANLYQKTGENFTSIEFWQKVYDIDEDEVAKGILGEFYFEQGDYKTAAKFGKIKPIKGTEQGSEPAVEDEGLLNKIMKFFGG